MSKGKKIMIVAIVAGIALLGYYLYRRYAGAGMDGSEEKSPVDKALRFVGYVSETKESRYASSNTGGGKSATFYTMPAKGEKEDRFLLTGGKSERFL